MTELELHKKMIGLANLAEDIGCGPIADDLRGSAEYLLEFINQNK